MTVDRTHCGREGEVLAEEHLRRKGYRIVHRNFRTPRGEIDIIARHKGVLVFVEVKTRRSRRRGHPKYAITPAKQKKISIVALEYLKKNEGTTQVKARFDVVTVETANEHPLIEVIPNAFELVQPH